jgi:hypothetical protein
MTAGNEGIWNQDAEEYLLRTFRGADTASEVRA